MKIETHTITKMPEGIEIKKQQEKELTLLASERKIKGLRVYEYNKATGEVVEAEYIQNDTFDILAGTETKLFVRTNCIYVQAINKANAAKKAAKQLAA